MVTTIRDLCLQNSTSIEIQYLETIHKNQILDINN